MKKRAKQILGWIHAGILLSVPAPLLYGLAVQGEAAYRMERIWLLSLLILAVLPGTDLLMEKCRRMSVYVSGGIVLAAAVVFAAWQLHGLAGEKHMGMGAVVMLAFASAWVFLERLLIRLHEKRAIDRMEKDPDWRPRQSVLTQPAAPYGALLVLAYGVGKYCNNPPLCNIAMGLLPVYICTALLYRYLERTEEYLSLNKRVCSIPQRRLYGISGCICLLFLSGIVCVGILAGVLSGGRTYLDIRELWKNELRDSDRPSGEFWAALDGGMQGEEGLPFFMEEVREPPFWAKFLEKAMAALVFGAALGLGLYGLRRVSHLFRDTYDENGDIVEDLEQEEAEPETVNRRAVSVGQGKLTEEEKIRRQYRRTIRKHRKDRPGRHETPWEIETGAGIAGTPDGQALHELYERARYGSR